MANGKTASWTEKWIREEVILRGRFAPSPTGLLHIGNALTAVLAWMHVRSQGGEFLLRIEDIDQQRCKSIFVDQLVEDLQWLGLDWDEGPDIGGPYMPYRQRDRQTIYDAAFTKLLEQALLYPCYCSRSELADVLIAPHGWFADEPRYPGICRHLKPHERVEKARHKAPAYRFRVPEQNIGFADEVYGEVNIRPSEGGDFIVRRSDSLMAYQLAVVVDDAAMGITHVLRGADLLASTSRQLLLYRALGYDSPTFAHTPLLLDEYGRRIAKRNSTATLLGMRQAGVHPEEIIGVIGWLLGLTDTADPLSLTELLSCFSISRIPQSPLRLSVECQKRLRINVTY
ncbi:tRNA glutamyl-Q(34) synthetase GluQRS [Alicyclobacillus sp. TC]|nr:tRNA glutamyl-Q(34) synthetase GluQRS [Alicyclobacillus sp. TC]